MFSCKLFILELGLEVSRGNTQKRKAGEIIIKTPETQIAETKAIEVQREIEIKNYSQYPTKISSKNLKASVSSN